MKQTVGQTTITIGNKRIKETDKAKQLRTKKKEAKNAYEIAIKTKNQIKETLHKYITAQQELREELAKINKEKTKEKLAKLAKEGYNNRQLIWKLKSETENNKQSEQYDTITEEDEILLEPEKKQRNTYPNTLKIYTKQDLPNRNTKQKQI